MRVRGKINSFIEIGVFVTGCHRSGTSYLSSLLTSIAGCSRNSDLDQTVDNPRGYFESTLLGPLNDELLRLAGARWDRPPLTPIAWSQGVYMLQAVRRKEDFSQYALTDLWVDKDPRLALTFPFYRHLLLKRVGCAVIVRHPADVAMSLEFRDGFPLEKGFLIWYLYNRHCSRFLQVQNDALLSYEQLLQGSREQLERLVRFVGADCNLNHALACHSQLTLRELRRSRLSESSLDLVAGSSSASLLIEYCLSIYTQLEASLFDLQAYCNLFAEVPAFLIDRYDSILSSGEPSLEYLRLYESAGVSAACSTGDLVQDQELIKTFADLVESLHALKVELVEQSVLQPQSLANDAHLRELALADELKQLQRSFSWRITAPLRFFRRCWN